MSEPVSDLRSLAFSVRPFPLWPCPSAHCWLDTCHKLSCCHECAFAVCHCEMLSFIRSFLYVFSTLFTCAAPFCHKGGVICKSEVIDIFPGNLDSSLCFLQCSVSEKCEIRPELDSEYEILFSKPSINIIWLTCSVCYSWFVCLKQS